MKKPQWYAEEVAKLGRLILNGASTRANALEVLVARIRSHPDYIAGLVNAAADKDLSKWLGDNAPEVASSQLLLFPEMPLQMRVAPAKTVEVADMTAEDLDHAKNMMLARTDNAIKGATAAAEREQRAFMAFYNKVRPLLTDDLTVADVLSKLAEKAA